MCPRSAGPTGRADPRPLADRVAEAVDTTWHRSAAATARIEIPLSVVAGLALIRTDPTDPDQSDAASADLRALPDEVMIAVLRDLWIFYLNHRPDLIARAHPLCSWLFAPEIDPVSAEAAVATARAALDAGQLRLTGTDLRYEVDLLGVVLTRLRSDSARKGKGQFYTPADVADLMAQMLGVGDNHPADHPDDGLSVHEPAAGTGGMLRAAAQAMRRAGRDPAAVAWSAVDIDELAIACLAVNAHLWNLGPDVLLGVGDALTDDWRPRAEGERAECLQLAQHIRGHRAALRLLDRTARLLDQVATEHWTGEEDHAV